MWQDLTVCRNAILLGLCFEMGQTELLKPPSAANRVRSFQSPCKKSNSFAKPFTLNRINMFPMDEVI